MTVDPPEEDSPDLYSAKLAFMTDVNHLFAAYLDALAGIDRLREDIIQFQQEKIEEIRKSDPDNATEEFLDTQALQQELVGGTSNTSKQLHISTQGEFKERTRDRGLDKILLGHMAIVRLYSLWEENHREKIALAAGFTTKNELGCDLFGDLAKMRHAVVHNNGIATSDVGAARKLKWFKHGDPISVTVEQVDHLFDMIDLFVTGLCSNSKSEK